MGVLLGYVWTEAVTVKIFTRFQIYTGTCGRDLSPRLTSFCRHENCEFKHFKDKFVNAIMAVGPSM